MSPAQRRVSARAALGAFALLLAILCLWFWPLFTGDQLSQSHILFKEHPFVAQAPAGLPETHSGEGDAARQYHVFLKMARRSLDEGRLPLWNPYSYAGMTFVGDQQSALAYPLTWLGFVLSPETAWGLIALLKLLTAGMGAYFLARQLRIGHGGGLLAGIAFMLSGPLIVWLQWPLTTAFSLLPWVLLATDRLRENRSGRAFAGLAAVVALGILAGHPESAFLSSCAAGLYLAVRLALDHAESLRGRLRLAGGWLGAHVAGLAASAVVAVPFLLAYQHSITRAEHGSFADDQLPMSSVIAYLLPNVYGNGKPDYVGPLGYYLLVTAYVGVAVLLLAGVAAYRLRANSAARSLAVVGLIGAAAAFGVPPMNLVLEHVPPFSGGNFQRCLFVPALVLAVGAGAGLESLLRRPLVVKRVLIVAAVPVGVVLAWALVDRVVDLWSAPGATERATVLHFAVALVGGLVCLLAPGRAPRNVAVGAVLVIAVLDLAFLQNFNQILPPEKAHPGSAPSLRYLQQQKRHYRISSSRPFLQTNVLSPNTFALHRIESIQGYDFPQPKRWSDLSWSVLGEKGFTREIITHNPPIKQPGLTALRMMNTRFYVLKPGATKSLPELRVAYRGPDATIFEDPQALPRAYVVGATQPASEAATVRALQTGRLDPRRSALVPPAAPPHPQPGGPVRPLRADQMTEESWKVDVPGGPGGWLVLANSFSEQWKVEVDGREAKLEPTNLAAMGVALPAGKHTVEFRFDRRPVYLGIGVSAVTWLLLLALALVNRPRPRPR